MRTLFTEFKANPMWPWLFGAILLMSGLVIIAFHQYWRSPAASSFCGGLVLAIRGLLLLTVRVLTTLPASAYNSGASGDMGAVRLPGPSGLY